MLHACKKIKIGHCAKFQDKKQNLIFLAGLITLSGNFMRISTSGFLRSRLLTQILIHSADARNLAMAGLRAQALLKTLLSRPKDDEAIGFSSQLSIDQFF